MALVVLLAAGALIWWASRHRTDQEDKLPAAVRHDLTIKARDALENGASSSLTPDEGRLACAVRVMGADPPALTARTLYVYAECATVGAEVATVSSLPVVLHLTDPPTAEVPGDGSLYDADIKRLFPARLRDLAYGDTYDLDPELRRRIQERS
ncbi:hypothetical protein ACQPZJ_19135 [Actinoplanes sp. CA-054009]